MPPTIGSWKLPFSFPLNKMVSHRKRRRPLSVLDRSEAAGVAVLPSRNEVVHRVPLRHAKNLNRSGERKVERQPRKTSRGRRPRPRKNPSAQRGEPTRKRVVRPRHQTRPTMKPPLMARLRNLHDPSLAIKATLLQPVLSPCLWFHPWQYHTLNLEPTLVQHPVSRHLYRATTTASEAGRGMRKRSRHRPHHVSPP